MMVDDGRLPTRPVGRKAKVTLGQRNKIRERARAGEPGVDLAREYGISPTRVSQIKHEDTEDSSNGASS